jgi:hypothetical protein
MGGALVLERRINPIAGLRCLSVNMPWLIPLGLCLALLALISGVFVASVRNARALRRDLDERFDAVQAQLEKQANALADELLARTKDATEQERQ